MSTLSLIFLRPECNKLTGKPETGEEIGLVSRPIFNELIAKQKSSQHQTTLNLNDLTDPI